MNNKSIKITKWIFFALMIIINLFIIYQSCLPDVSSKSWSDAVVDMIKTITHGDIDSGTPITPNLSWGKLIRKLIGHFSLFGLDGVITYLYFYFLNRDRPFKYKYLYIIIPSVIGILLAVITECLQLVIPGRVGDIIDILIDIAGFLLGLGITFLITYLINRHNNKKILINNN